MSDFIDDNKKALLEEMAESLSVLNEVITNYVNMEPNENVLIQMSMIFSSMSNRIGYLTAVFNQYFSILTNEAGLNKPIGFEFLKIDKKSN